MSDHAHSQTQTYNTLTDATLTAGATYRLTKLIQEDEILSPLRDRFHTKFPPESTKLGYLSTCPWCLSMWIAPIAHILPTPIKAALTASAVTGVISERL